MSEGVRQNGKGGGGRGSNSTVALTQYWPYDLNIEFAHASSGGGKSAGFGHSFGASNNKCTICTKTVRQLRHHFWAISQLSIIPPLFFFFFPLHDPRCAVPVLRLGADWCLRSDVVPDIPHECLRVAQVYQSEYVGASGKCFHKACFRCTDCKKMLTASDCKDL